MSGSRITDAAGARVRTRGSRPSHVLIAAISFDRHQGGGAVRLAYDLAQGLVQNGHRVTVVSEDQHDHGTEVERADGMMVLRYRLPPARGLAPRRHLDHLAATTALLRKHLPEPPDAVHGHGLLQYLAALRLYRGEVRCGYSIHSPSVDEMRIAWGSQGARGAIKQMLGLPVIRRLEAECLRDSDVLTAESEFTRTLIREQYGEEYARRVTVIPGWVDMDRFRPLSAEEIRATRSRLGWPSDRPVLFALRRLEARMGLDNLLRALHLVKARGYSVFTAIGGSGSQLGPLKELSASLGLASDIRFHGFVSGEELPFAYGACDASIIPTAHLECFGLIALEAMACGRPALVTPVGALPEVVGGIEPRWISESNAPAPLADHICAFLDGALPPLDGERVRRELAQRFGFAPSLARHEALLLGRSSAPSASLSRT